MSCVRSLLLVSFVCASLRAETVLIIQGGKSWFVPDGSSVGVLVDRVVRLGGNGPVDPTDPPTDPPTDGDLERLSSAWVVKVAPYELRDHHRQGLMATYSVLGQQAADGKFSSLAELQKRTKETYNLLLGVEQGSETSVDKERWREWFRPIEVYLGANVRSVEQAVPAYSEIAAGLEIEDEAIGPVWTIVIRMIIQFLGEGTIPPAMLALIMALLDTLAGGAT